MYPPYKKKNEKISWCLYWELLAQDENKNKIIISLKTLTENLLIDLLVEDYNVWYAMSENERMNV